MLKIHTSNWWKCVQTQNSIAIVGQVRFLDDVWETWDKSTWSWTCSLADCHPLKKGLHALFSTSNYEPCILHRFTQRQSNRACRCSRSSRCCFLNANLVGYHTFSNPKAENAWVIALNLKLIRNRYGSIFSQEAHAIQNWAKWSGDSADTDA